MNIFSILYSHIYIMCYGYFSLSVQKIEFVVRPRLCGKRSEYKTLTFLIEMKVSHR